MRFTLYHLLMVDDYVNDRHSYYCLSYSILIHVFLRYCFSIRNTLREAGTHTKGDLGEFHGRSKIPSPCIGSTEHTFGFTALTWKDALVSVSNLVHTRRSTFSLLLQVSDAVCSFVLLASEA
jgi:hypothetical protein